MDLNCLVGLSFTDVELNNSTWRFSIGVAYTLTVECPWRIISQDRIAVADADHGQQFGRPHPVDVASESARLLIGRRIEQVDIRSQTDDLCLLFDGGVRLETFTDSSGWESWQLADSAGLIRVGSNA